MLQHLQIENIALIDQISITPSSSFNVLTGETGAGKSIIIDSINFVLGRRVSKEFIKTGKEKAIVEAVFDSIDKLSEFFEENGLKFDAESIILYREYNASGKSIARVNGRIVNTSMLAEIGAFLVDMHGQYDNQSLMKSALHMTLLDLFCGKELFEKLSHYQVKLNEWKGLKNQLQMLKEDAQSRAEKIDLLRFQIDEIEKAKLTIGEDVALANQRALLKNWSKINECMTFAYAKLAESVEGNAPSIDQIASAAAKLNQAAPFHDDIAQIAEKLNELVFQLQEVNAGIRDYIFAQEFSASELEELEERLDLIVQLKKKYGSELCEIFDYYDHAKIELEEIDISPEQILALETACEAAEASAYTLATEISQTRKDVASTIETRVAKELEELEMRGAVFQASFTETSMQVSGIDKMEFLFSANKGEPVKPLSKIASGGEMSRVMLAIKSILAEVDQIPLLIFDEIDSGISGVASQKVGEKLKSLARNHQV
ncbi:MAG: DNA repair protein RecN, partial [Clostridia bacterium]